MPDVTLFLIATLTTLLAYCLISLISSYSYWKSKGIAYVKPLPLFGNFLPVICFKKAISDVYTEAYYKFPNEKVVGVYEAFSPVLVPRDPKIIERILVKDFQHFVNRAQITETGGLFDNALFQMKGSAWRSVRYNVRPAFSSGRLKSMFNGMLECTDQMIALVDKNLNKDYEVREAFAFYAINVIANTVFGIQINDKQAMDEFIRMGTSIFNTQPLQFVETLSLFLFPKFADRLGFSFMTDEAEQYYKGLIKNTLKQRESGEYHRNDYTQYLLKLKQQGALEVQSKDAEDDDLRVDGAAPSDSIG